MASWARRIQREMKEMEEDPPMGCTAGPMNPENIHKWKAIIFGPPETPYEGGSFELEINFPNDYPFRPPHCRFTTKIYHPNINAEGGICVDILKPTSWSPALTVGKVLLSISSLMADPNPDDPLMPDIAFIFKNNREQFLKIAREWTRTYA